MARGTSRAPRQNNDVTESNNETGATTATTETAGATDAESGSENGSENGDDLTEGEAGGLEICRVRGKKTFLVYKNGEDVGRISQRGKTWEVAYQGTQVGGGFKGAAEARGYLRGFLDGVEHAGG